jgi:hypothetical protein
MAINKAKVKPNKAPTVAANLRQSFVKKVHLLLAAAYEKLKLSVWKKEETDITGLLTKEMNAVIESPNRPRGTTCYVALEEVYINTNPALFGKRRKRVDIEVQSLEHIPRPHFQFEAKRLYDSHGLTDYVGKDGLACFLSGDYGVGHLDGGMLGYVQSDDEDFWRDKIEKELISDRAKHQLAARGKVWKPRPPTPGLDYSYLSTHKRSKGSIVIHHTFLRCY